VNPESEIALPAEAGSGTAGVNAVRNDLVYPPPGHEVYAALGQAGSGLSVGRNGVCVYEHGDHYFAPVLVYGGAIEGWTHVAVVYREGVPRLYVNGKLVRTGVKGAMVVHPGVGVVHGRSVTAFRGRFQGLAACAKAMEGAEIERAAQRAPCVVEAEELPALAVMRQEGVYRALVWRAGEYTLTTASGGTVRVKVPEIPAAREVGGRWELRFPAGQGAPERVALDRLISWSRHEQDGVKHFSGTATYRTSFEASTEIGGADRRVFLDLGRVEVMARVKVNGRDLGVLWKPPYRVEVTEALKSGRNELEVAVTNLWVNRLIGDEELREDSERNPNGTLKEWPDWLREGKASPAGRYTFTTHRLWGKEAPLLESGLLGPVMLRSAVLRDVPLVPREGS
jgi:hypothetical protein